MSLLRQVRLASLLIGLCALNNSAMAFGVLDKTGENRAFSELSATGDWLLVMIWSHDCIPCERQKPMISQFAVKNKRAGIRVVGMSSDDRQYLAKARAIMKESKTTFDNYLYNGVRFSNDYLVITGERFLATPTYLVYGPDGTIKDVHVGPIQKSTLTKYFADKKSDASASHPVDLVQ